MYKIANQTTGSVFSARADESVLDAGLRQGHVLPYSCRDGACGSCRVDLISGEFEYLPRDPDALTPADVSGNKILLCQAHARSDLTIRAREAVRAAGITIKTMPCRVHDMQRLAPDVMQLHLNLPKTQELEYLAGQYIDIILRDGRRRSFSIANAPTDDSPLELHIRQVDGGRFTEQVFESMKKGDLLRFEGPLGTFYLREADQSDLIFLAGGTGFAPIKAIIEQAIDDDAFGERNVHLYWGVRSLPDLYQREVAEQFATLSPRLSFTPVLSDPSAGDWDGATGFVHERVLIDNPSLANFEVYASGPPAMINAARDSFTAAGMRTDCFYFDSFEYSVD